MLPWQQRVIAEKVQLDERLANLNVFLANEQIHDIPAFEVGWLIAQTVAMNSYSHILGQRIAHFTRDP